MYERCELEGVGDLPVEKIIPVFSKKSLAEVVETLKKDGSEWAQKTLNKIYWKDPLASVLTFELVRKAKELSFVECL